MFRRETRKHVFPAAVVTALSGPAMAQDLILEEVIVTAQKRVETLAETPMTVNVVTADQIAEFGNFTISDINNMTTGLSIIGGGTDWDFAIRGVGTDINAPTVPRMSFYVDGSYFQQPRGLLTGLFDIAQLEILRGPQGTLYGQTSPMGAVTIRSQNPSLEEFDGYIRQSFTDRKGSNTQLAVSLPLIRDTLGIRVAGLYDTNEHSDIENVTLDRDLENQTTSYRIVALWEPTENMDLRLSYFDIKDEFDIDSMVEGNGIDLDDRYAVGETPSSFENDTRFVAFEGNYAFANDWVATLTASDLENLLPRDYDNEGSEVFGQNVFLGGGVPDVQTYELRLASQGNEQWDWTVGAFYMDTDSQTDIDTDTITAVAPGFTVYSNTISAAILSTEQRAVFTHNSIHLTENGTLTLGLRYADYERESLQPFNIDVFVLLPNGDRAPLGTIITDGVPEADQRDEDDAVTGTLRYQHQFTDELMAYAAYDRAWLPGAVNISATPLPPQFGAFDGEDAESFEVGFKWELFGGRGLWNVALYYQVFEDFLYNAEQFEFRAPEGEIGVATAVVNVPEAETYGFDTDLAFLVAENWTLRAGLSYNQAELSDAKGTPCTNGEPIGEEIWSFNTCDFTGDRAGAEPEWSANLASEYSLSVGNDMEWYIRGLFNYESEYFSISTREDLDSYAMLDLYTGLRSPSGTWDVNVWAKNVTDESAILKAETLGPIPDLEIGAQVPNPYTWLRRSLEPRLVGVTLNWNF